jgi:hypothetical protein
VCENSRAEVVDATKSMFTPNSNFTLLFLFTGYKAMKTEKRREQRHEC